MTSLLRWREPAAVVLLVVLALRLLLTAGLALGYAASGSAVTELAAYTAAGPLGEPAGLVLLVAVVACCRLVPATAHARTLAVLALVLAALAVVVLVLTVVPPLSAAPRADLTPPLAQVVLVDQLLGLVVPVLAVLALAALVRRPAGSGAGLLPAPTAPALEPGVGSTPAEEAEPEQQPTFPRDEAAGAVWSHAGDAAAGRPAAWGVPSPSEHPAQQSPQHPGEDEPPAHPWAVGPR